MPLAYIYKRIFGDAGLSAELKEMWLGECDNYKLLHRTGYLSYLISKLLLAYCSLKYFRRILIVKSRS